MWTTTEKTDSLYSGGAGPAGVYLHVPFCSTKCPYCAFYSHRGLEGLELYLSTLQKEAHTLAEQLNREPTTLYIGGGTPSLLPLKAWEVLGEVLAPFAPREEWTVEANPESFSPELAQLWQDMGVTRVSFGVQSLHDDLLKRLCRPHRRHEALQAVEVALARGFRVSADLMFGLPDGSSRAFAQDARELIALGVEHLSLYQLSLEEGTPWGRKPPLLTDGVSSYIWAQWALPRLGLAQYEVASFARPGGESRHNCLYWSMDDVAPLGPSAWGFWGGLRTANPPSLEDWAQSVFEGRGPRIERKSPAALASEAAFLGLRRSQGLTRGVFEARFGPQLWNAVLRRTELWPEDCYRRDEESLSLTAKGLRLGNALWCDLLDLEDEYEQS